MKKKVINWIILLLLVVTPVLQVSAEEAGETSESQNLEAYAEPTKVNIGEHTIGIVSTNDIHAHASGDDSTQLGMAKIKTIIEKTKSENELTLALDAGDFYHGQAFATLEKGESMAKLAAAVGYDAIEVGNHDWNYGSDQLKVLESISQTGNDEFALLGGNVINNDGTPFFDHPYIVRELSIDGLDSAYGSPTVKVGVFGVIDPEIYSDTTPWCVEGLQYTDMIEYTKKAVDQLKAEGCQIIIGMSHCIDTEGLAEKTSEVNLWIDGHDHISQNELVTNAVGENVRVLEAGYYGSEADVTRMTFDGTSERDRDGNITTEIQNLSVETTVYPASDTTIEKDAGVQQLYEQIAGDQEEVMNKVIGKTPVDLKASWEEVRIDETTMGRVVTDAYLRQTGADIAFENAGGIRTNGTVLAGDIKNRDVINTFPFGNYIVTKQITGSQVKSMLETSIEIERQNREANDSGDYNAWPSNSGSYLQVGGIEVHYDLSKEAGNRIKSITKDGRELESSSLYLVAINNYLAISEDYPELASASEVNQYNACDEAFINYVEADTQEGGLIAASTSLKCLIEDKKSEPDPKPTPINLTITATDGKNLHISGEDTTLTFTCPKSVQELQKIRVDGQDVSTDNYTMEGDANLTSIILKASYLNSLPEGEHSLEFVYQDGSTGLIKFQIGKKNASVASQTQNTVTNTAQNSKAASTGDHNSMIWVVTMTVSMSFVMILTMKRKRYNTK